MTTVDLTSYTMVEMAIFNTAGMAGTYAALNGSSSYAIYTGNGFPDDIKILKIYNDGTQGVTISLDGTTNHDYMPSKGTLIVDLQANHADTSSFGSGTKNGRKGQILYGKGTAGTGNIYISGFR